MRKGVRLCITGSEVMNGFVLDRNTQFFASELYARGYELMESRILHDDREQILKTWREFAATGDIVVNSGGLGPTSDDLTVDLLCEWLNDTAVYDPHSERRTRYFFERRAREQSAKGAAKPGTTGGARAVSIEVALRQTRLPSRARAIKNTVGLAPGIFLPEINFIALPGFPDEIRGMWKETLGIMESLSLTRHATKIIPVWGVGESQLFSELSVPDSVTVGVHALPWGCRLFLRSGPSIRPDGLLRDLPSTQPDGKRRDLPSAETGNRSLSAVEMSEQIDSVAAAIAAKFPGQVVDDPLADVIEYCKTNALTLSLAESCTGGMAGKQVTDHAGVSAIFKGSAVTYANEAKTGLLGVAPQLIAEHGAVSAECAAAMARGAADRFDSTLSLAFTGIAGPDGGSADKPVGTVFIALHDARTAETRVARFGFPFGRERFRSATVACGFLALRQYLQQSTASPPFPLQEFRTLG